MNIGLFTAVSEKEFSRFIKCSPCLHVFISRCVDLNFDSPKATSKLQYVWKRSVSTQSFSVVFTESCIHIETTENTYVSVLRMR